MTVELAPPLAALAEWIRATDPHAAHRLAILDRAQRVAAGVESCECSERRGLAECLEHWRYQLLDEHRAGLDPLGSRLADVLDVARAGLLGRRLPGPRSPRQALRGCDGDPAVFCEALAALDRAAPLDELCARAAELTAEHFTDPASGRRRVLLYAPLYLSSFCTNYCAYCRFRFPREMERRHLDPDEVLRQADILLARGLRHLLLVAGDHPQLARTAYFVETLEALVERGIDAALEIAPQPTEDYAWLAEAGACGLTLYQETYHPARYADYHPRGTKASYDWRLEGPERAAEAGLRRLGLGILLGLGEPAEELLALMRHARYLQRRFPDLTIAFSLPRIHDAPEGFEPPQPVDDETLVRMYGALRIAFPEAELVLSTREPAALRNRLASICITQLSAGSSTAPGGYADEANGADSCVPDDGARGQFAVADHRRPAEIAAWLRQAGIEPAWS
jgi:2-iminoacetate synthase